MGVTVGLGVELTGGVTGIGDTVGLGVWEAFGGVTGAVIGKAALTCTLFPPVRNGNINTAENTKMAANFCNLLIAMNYRIKIFICQIWSIVALLFWWPNSLIAFEVPKVNFILWSIRAAILWVILSIIRKNIKWRVSKTLLIGLAGYVLCAFFASVVGADFSKSLVGNPYRTDGLVTLITLAGGSWALSYFWHNNYKVFVAEIFCWSSVIASALSLYEILTGRFGLGTAATFGNPNFLAGFLVTSLPFWYFLYIQKRNKLYVAGQIIVVLAIILVGAISAILTLLLYVGIIVAMDAPKRFKAAVMLICTVSAAAIFLIWFNTYTKTNSQSFIAEGRARIYRNVFVAALTRPITGFGVANVDYAFKSVVWPVKFESDVYVDKAHASLLEVFATTGLMGTITYLALLAAVFRHVFDLGKKKLNQSWSRTLLFSLILYLFHSQTNVISISEEVIFWTILGSVMKIES